MDPWIVHIVHCSWEKSNISTIKKKKKTPAKTQTCVWEAQNALPKRTIIGDFNEVLSVNEKEGGVDRLSRQIEKFRCCLESTGLRDLVYMGCSKKGLWLY